MAGISASTLRRALAELALGGRGVGRVLAGRAQAGVGQVIHNAAIPGDYRRLSDLAPWQADVARATDGMIDRGVQREFRGYSDLSELRRALQQRSGVRQGDAYVPSRSELQRSQYEAAPQRVRQLADALREKHASGNLTWDDLDEAGAAFGGPVTPDELDLLRAILQ